MSYSLIHITGLGCDFFNEQCSNHIIFPYLCDTSVAQLVCTYDHLTKVRIGILMSLSRVIILLCDICIHVYRVNVLLTGVALMVVQ